MQYSLSGSSWKVVAWKLLVFLSLGALLKYIIIRLVRAQLILNQTTLIFEKH